MDTRYARAVIAATHEAVAVEHLEGSNVIAFNECKERDELIKALKSETAQVAL